MKTILRTFCNGSGCILVLLLFIIQPGRTQTRPVEGLHENTPNVIALTHAEVVSAPGRRFTDAVLVIRDGKIEAAGTDITIPADAVIRDLSGKTVYPGFIDLYTHYGIPEETQVNQDENDTRGARHWNESVHPEINAAELFKPDAKTAKELRGNGFTCAAALPQGALFRGSGALVLISDIDGNSAILKSDIGQSMAFSKGRRSREYPNSLMGAVALIRQTLLDADWYGRAQEAYQASPEGQTFPGTNLSLEALQSSLGGKKPVIIETSSELDMLRADKLAREFGLSLRVKGSGSEYRRLAAIEKIDMKLILPLNFPPAPDVTTASKELDTSLRELRHWEQAPGNPARLYKANVPFALTTADMKNAKEFLPQLRKTTKRGLPAEAALAALTTTPAAWLDMNDILGTLETGKIANIIVADGDIFQDDTNILDVYVSGKKYTVTEQPRTNVRGTWDIDIELAMGTGYAETVISGKPEALQAKIIYEGTSVKAAWVKLENKRIAFVFSADSFGFPGVCRMSGTVEEKKIAGQGTWVDGSGLTWHARMRSEKEEKKTIPAQVAETAELETVYPEGAFGRSASPEQPDYILIKNGTLWTSGPDGILKDSDMLIERGKIAVIGAHIPAPEGAYIIDAAGKHISPGIIDAHSHLAISGGVNEGTHANTAETRIEDVIDPDDMNIYRQLAGGVTMAELIHGSANPIGGQTATVKLRWGALPEEMIFENAMPGIKFALGENVKQSNWGRELTRYPKTRMGVEQYFRDAFQAAKDYRLEWQKYQRERYTNPNLVPPRKIIRYEALLEVLDGRRQVHCHSYRQDEILATLRLAEEIGFKIDVLIHILEGYKVAEAIKAHGAMPSTFSDWWAYKFEVIDAIPYNGPLMYEQGLPVSFNSDNYELARHLNTEAAKAVKYGNVPPEEALKFVTLNPAKQLRIDRYTGSLEAGKDADFVIWSGSPLSSYSICEETWIDGKNYFNIKEDRWLRTKAEREKTRLAQKILQEK